jgi:hypothetical protein
LALTNNNTRFSLTVSASGIAGTTGSGASTGVTAGTLNFAKTLQAAWLPTGSTAITGMGFASGSIAAAGSTTIDMFGGTLLALDGTALVLAGVKFVFISLVDSAGGIATAGSLEVGGAGSNPNILWFKNTSDISKVTVGGPPFIQGSATAVTVNSTNRNILIANPSGVTAYYQCFIAGVV